MTTAATLLVHYIIKHVIVQYHHRKYILCDIFFLFHMIHQMKHVVYQWNTSPVGAEMKLRLLVWYKANRRSKAKAVSMVSIDDLCTTSVKNSTYNSKYLHTHTHTHHHLTWMMIVLFCIQWFYIRYFFWKEVKGSYMLRATLGASSTV